MEFLLEYLLTKNLPILRKSVVTQVQFFLHYLLYKKILGPRPTQSKNKVFLLFFALNTMAYIILSMLPNFMAYDVALPCSPFNNF